MHVIGTEEPPRDESSEGKEPQRDESSEGKEKEQGGQDGPRMMEHATPGVGKSSTFSATESHCVLCSISVSPAHINKTKYSSAVYHTRCN
jgi:hypothetical protein